MNTRDPGTREYAKPITRVLLVEDDPTSREFIAHAVKDLPAIVDCAGSVRQALAIGETCCHDLWLIDAQLPDGCGSDLLTRLRPRYPDTPAIAHTASNDRGTRDALVAAGFVEVLIKPLASSAILSAVRRHLGASMIHEPCPLDRSGPGDLPIWDDEAAARALGHDPGHVQALRRLFMDELPRVRQRARSAINRGDCQILAAELHKLRASCGFVGAARLGDVARRLLDSPANAPLQDRLEAMLVEMLEREATSQPEGAFD